MTKLSPQLRQATPVVASRGEGVRIIDPDGRRYLDFTAGIGVTSTGHCHPKVVAAAQEQVATLIHGQYTTVMHEPLRRLVESLGEVLPSKLDSLFFTNSGSEAIEAALRLARQSTGRPNIIVCHGGFHGRTVATASMTTSGTKFRSGFAPLMAGVVHTPFPTAYRYGWDADTATKFALREFDYTLQTLTAPADTAAVIVEPVLGEGGYIPATEEFLRGLRERADKHGFLLIVDEVQTGVGRTGKFWGHDHFGVTPDILVTAKGLASGFPLSGIAASEELMSKAWPGSQGGTYGANAVACAAAVATLEVVHEEKLVHNAEVMGQRLRAGLERVGSAHDAIGDVRGLGLMLASEFVTPQGDPDPETAQRAQKAAVDEGLLLLTCGPFNNVVRMIPALIVDEPAIDEGLRAWAAAVERAVS
ncbi:4-aminobutyrate aminotransferase [Herbihabitans rhizosphaerae]|uniref:(S)-3-amino-2-methylpropionate transaminase n=1 Tax=Herbihabitans rhizosphaerae TaxID=1872711 RepID=A0A4Q7L3Q7_9PSEU|nr:aminotransferase class III-fold pyridoxal phosphate-dependent enzyme [Herbihabitans rhizosphaerae]RZS43786.1 4-aminobutyrate aminotransferase [Herbihabitans rhizosphaerae]